MSNTLAPTDAPADAELISAVRGGDVDAYGQLFARHVDAARRLARQIAPASDVDDLVSDGFAKVLTVLQRGGGPDVAFRAYLLTAVRRLHVDRIRAAQKLHSTDDLEKFDPGIPFEDTAVAGFENAAAARAFASLPERWQLVLWHTEVEGQKPAEIAPLLGMSANSVSALAYRAREGLRQAFLNQHAQELEGDTCRWVHQHLGAYVRGGTARRDGVKIEQHLDECRKCMAIYLELTEVNSNLAGIIAPLLLGASGLSYAAVAGGASKSGLLLFVDRLRDGALSQGAAVTTAAGVTAAAAAVVIGAAVLARDSGPAPATTAVGPSSSASSGAAARPETNRSPAPVRERIVVAPPQRVLPPADAEEVAAEPVDVAPPAAEAPASDEPGPAGDDVVDSPDPVTEPPGSGTPGTQEPPGSEDPGTEEPPGGEDPGTEEPPGEPTTADVGIDLASISVTRNGANYDVTGSVTGFEDAGARVRIWLLGLEFISAQGHDCLPETSGAYLCDLPGSDFNLKLRLLPGVAVGTVAIEAVPPEGTVDDQPANNWAVVPVGTSPVSLERPADSASPTRTDSTPAQPAEPTSPAATPAPTSDDTADDTGETATPAPSATPEPDPAPSEEPSTTSEPAPSPTETPAPQSSESPDEAPSETTGTTAP